MSSEYFSSLWGTSLDDLRQYTDVLLGAAELAEALESHDPKATDRHYRVSDPRVVNAITVPPEITSSLGSSYSPESVTFRSLLHTKDHDVLVSSSLSLEFGEIVAHIQLSEGEVIVSYENDAALPHKITIESLSAIIARLTHPSNDPMFSDFRDIDNPFRANEICETLGQTDFVTQSIERTFEINDEYQVITQTTNGKLIACEIVEFRDESSSPVTLTVEFQHFSTASNLYKSTPDGSEELIIDAGDFDRFGTIITRIMRLIEPDASTQSID